MMKKNLPMIIHVGHQNVKLPNDMKMAQPKGMRHPRLLNI